MSPDTDSVFWKYILFFHQLPFIQVFRRQVGRGHHTKKRYTEKKGERSLRGFSYTLVFCVFLNSKIIFTNPYLQVFYWTLNLVTCKLLGMNIKITAQWSLIHLQKKMFHWSILFFEWTHKIPGDRELVVILPIVSQKVFHNKVLKDLQSQKVTGLTLPQYPKDLKQRQELMEWTQHWYPEKRYWRHQIKTIRHFSIEVREFFFLLLDVGFTSEGKETVLTFSKLNLYDRV